MHACESWTIKKAERWRIDAFELWYSRRLLRVPWTTRRSNQSILKEISPEYSLEGLMLKLQSFGYLMQRTDSLEDSDAEDWRQERKGMTGWDGWMASMTQWTWVWASSGSWWWKGKPGVWQSKGLQSQTWLSDWTKVNVGFIKLISKMKEFWVAQDLNWVVIYIHTHSTSIAIHLFFSSV